MKTTMQLPDTLFRRAKATAASRGQSLKAFVAEALQEKLSISRRPASSSNPPWMQGFGALRHLRKETARVQTRIDKEFEVIEPEDRT